jgi:hypothetical protein
MRRALDPTQENPGANTWRACAWTSSSENLVRAALELSLTATERVEQERAALDRI